MHTQMFLPSPLRWRNLTGFIGVQAMLETLTRAEASKLLLTNSVDLLVAFALSPELRSVPACTQPPLYVKTPNIIKSRNIFKTRVRVKTRGEERTVVEKSRRQRRGEERRGEDSSRVVVEDNRKYICGVATYSWRVGREKWGEGGGDGGESAMGGEGKGERNRQTELQHRTRQVRDLGKFFRDCKFSRRFSRRTAETPQGSFEIHLPPGLKCPYLSARSFKTETELGKRVSRAHYRQRSRNPKASDHI